MKKKDKPADTTQAGFTHTPFRSLKGMAPRTPPQESKTRQPTRPPRTQTEDDATLFLRAVAGARQFVEPDGRSSRNEGTAGAARTVPADTDEQRLFLEAMEKIGPLMREQRSEEMSGEEHRRSPSSRMRQLKRGTLRIAGELDLHGCVRSEALIRLEQFIASAFRRGSKAVLVITGKGLNSPEGPVLREAVAGWLRERGRQAGMVAEFGRAPRDKGGSGAFVVFLKNG